jgi:pilus assembly protein TadC
MLFGKKKKIIIEGKEIELQPKPKLGLFTSKQNTLPNKPAANPQPFKTNPKMEKQTQNNQIKNLKTSKFRLYLTGIGVKHKGLESALRQQGVKENLYKFVKRMFVSSIILGILIGISVIIIFMKVLTTPNSLFISILLGFVLGFMTFKLGFESFLNFPTHKGKRNTKLIDKDIIFAASDLVISLRSGVPLYNAITSVSTGYGEASNEFAKIVNRVRLGIPLVDAIDQTIDESSNKSFKRLMLQASVSIKSGADISVSLSEIIDDLITEREIELRRYGQKLNVLAMFYMIFGIILPSMGIAVITIITTFVSIFTVNITVLEAAVVVIIFVQLIFLQLIKNARPAFAT